MSFFWWRKSRGLAFLGSTVRLDSNSALETNDSCTTKRACVWELVMVFHPSSPNPHYCFSVMLIQLNLWTLELLYIQCNTTYWPIWILQRFVFDRSKVKSSTKLYVCNFCLSQQRRCICNAASIFTTALTSLVQIIEALWLADADITVYLQHW